MGNAKRKLSSITPREFDGLLASRTRQDEQAIYVREIAVRWSHLFNTDEFMETCWEANVNPSEWADADYIDLRRINTKMFHHAVRRKVDEKRIQDNIE